MFDNKEREIVLMNLLYDWDKYNTVGNIQGQFECIKQYAIIEKEYNDKLDISHFDINLELVNYKSRLNTEDKNNMINKFWWQK